MSTKSLAAAAAIPAELQRAALTHFGTCERDELVAARVDQLRVGDVAVVHAFGAWRTGVVVKVTRTRASIAYRTPSNPTLVRVATTSTPGVHQFFFDNHPGRA